MREALSRIKCVDSFTLKMIALVTMTIDHTTYVLSEFYPFFAEHRMLLRGIGRIAFPIYCFLLVEGYFHTRNVKKYIGRLLLVFLLAEYPFDLALCSCVPDWEYQNVMLTLAIGLMAVALIDHAKGWAQKLTENRSAQIAFQLALSGAAIIGGIRLADLCATDYGGGGVVFILLFYLFRKHPIALTVSLYAAMYQLFWWFEAIGILAMIPILLYNGRQGAKPGGQLGKWFFYLYYPLHLLVLGLAFAI